MFELVLLVIAAVTPIRGRRLRALSHERPLFDVAAPDCPPARGWGPCVTSELSCSRRSSRAGEAEPSGYGFVILAASFPWIDALLRLRWHEEGGGNLRPVLGCATPLSKSNPKPPSPSPVFCYPSPRVGARSVCCSKPGLTNMIFSFFFFSFPA